MYCKYILTCRNVRNSPLKPQTVLYYNDNSLRSTLDWDEITCCAFVSLTAKVIKNMRRYIVEISGKVALSGSPAWVGSLWWNSAAANTCILNPFYNKDTETIEEITNTEPDWRRRKFGLVTSLPTGILQSLHKCIRHDVCHKNTFKR